MPLKLVARPNGILRIRGTVQGRRIDESSGTRVRAEAEAIKAKLEADLFKRAIYGDASVATFEEAALAYMEAGGSRDHLTYLLRKIGKKRLLEVTQAVLSNLGAERPNLKPATLIRQIYTPVSAVMNFAATEAGGKLCNPVKFKRPKVRNARINYLTPEEAEAWIDALPAYLSRLVTFFIATGCRASEVIELEWREISPDARRVILWETKSGYARSFDLQERARAVLGPRGEPGDRVFLNSHGEPWSDYRSVNNVLKKFHDRRPDLRYVHLHLFRHTWATWAYASTRDLTFLMASGGWRTMTMVSRYVHGASPDFAQQVVDAGWAFFGHELPGLKRKTNKAA